MIQFRKQERYYNIYEQSNLFGGTTVISSWGTVDSKRGGHKKIFCDSREEVENCILQIRKIRLKKGYELC